MREHNHAMRAAFRTALWGRETRMTPLRDTLIEPDAEKRAEAHTPDEHIAAMNSWVIATGGSLEEPATKPKRRRRPAAVK